MISAGEQATERGVNLVYHACTTTLSENRVSREARDCAYKGTILKRELVEEVIKDSFVCLELR